MQQTARDFQIECSLCEGHSATVFIRSAGNVAFVREKRAHRGIHERITSLAEDLTASHEGL